MRKTCQTTLGRCILLTLVLVGMAFNAVSAFAGDSEVYFIQHSHRRYFDMPLDARGVGLAGSNVPVSTGASSVWGNPAGLGWLDKYELSLSYRFDELSGDDFPMRPPVPVSIKDDNLHTEMLQLGVPLSGGEWGVLGIGASHYHATIDDSVDTDNDGYTLHLSYGRQLNEFWSVGYALGYHQDHEDDIYAHSDTQDGLSNRLGLQYKPIEPVTLGLSGFYAFADPETDIRTLGDNDSDSDSWGLNLGMSYRVLQWLMLYSSVDYTEYDLRGDIETVMIDEDVDEGGDTLGARLGMESRITDWLSLRLGYRYQRSDYDFENIMAKHLSENFDFHSISSGFGLALGEQIKMDYGFEYRFIAEGDMTQAVTLKYEF